MEVIAKSDNSQNAIFPSFLRMHCLPSLTSWILPINLSNMFDVSANILQARVVPLINEHGIKRQGRRKRREAVRDA